MKRTSYGSNANIEFPLNLRQRLVYIFLILLSILIMFFSKLDLALISSIRTIVTDISTPIIYIFSKQTDLFDENIKFIYNFSNLREKNKFLLEENNRLKKHLLFLKQKENENLILKKQLNLIPVQVPNFISARAISAPGSVYAHTLLLQIGKETGIEKGNAVLFDGSLIGQIIEVGQLSSRVLLISDVNSMIPVILSESRIPGIISGKNNKNLSLNFLPKDIIPNAGEFVQTSGHGGLFPAGLPVGNVNSVMNNEIIVKPLVNMNSIDFVQIIQWRAENVEHPYFLNSEYYKPLKTFDNQNAFEGITARKVVE